MIKKELGSLLKVLQIPLFQDNYSYLLTKEGINEGILVDPADPIQIIKILNENFPQQVISHVFYTHKHWDHCQDSDILYEQLKNRDVQKEKEIKFVASEIDGQSIKFTNFQTKDNEQFLILGGDFLVKTLLVPCHTKGHQLYLIEEKGYQGVNINEQGDTLFIGGCGRFFEGNAEQMLSNMDRISQLHPETLIFCGHEYTKSNYEWAVQIDQQNVKLQERFKWAQDQNLQEKSTVPSTIQIELETNPFMRTRNAHFKNNFQLDDPVLIMNQLREMKNVNKTFKL